MWKSWSRTKCVFSYHSGIKLEINKIKTTGKSPNNLEIKQHISKQATGQRGSTEEKTLNAFNWMKIKIQNV